MRMATSSASAVHHQLLRQWADFAHTDGEGRITHVALVHRTAVHGDDVALLQLALARDAMHQLLVNAGADAGWVGVRPGVVLEGRINPITALHRFGNFVQLTRGYPRGNRFPHCFKRFGINASCLAHDRDLRRAFKVHAIVQIVHCQQLLK